MEVMLSSQDQVTIQQWIGGSEKTFRLLFSASSNGCNPAQFHDNCDNQGPTVTVVKNVNGSVYGGYASVSWTSGNGESVHDTEAFMFVLRGQSSPCKFENQTPEFALTMDQACGPVFGNGTNPDLLVFKDVIAKANDDSFPLNSVMSPGTYITNTITEITAGKFDAVDVRVYAVEDKRTTNPPMARESSVEGIYNRDAAMETPWREIDTYVWDEKFFDILKQNVIDYWPLKNMKVSKGRIPYVNILLLGPVGAGKSSFVNTLKSIFQERLSMVARAGNSETSLTKSLNVYDIIGNKEEPKFRICDCRGLEDLDSIQTSDIDNILNGHIKDQYELKDNPITMENLYYRTNPEIHNKIHCVAIVVDANNDPDYPFTEQVDRQIKEAQKIMNRNNIPQVILMNKIDGLSETVKADLSRTFHSPRVQERVGTIAAALSLPPSQVLPMKNMHMEHETNLNINILALYNLRQMLRAADDYLSNNIDDYRETRWWENLFAKRFRSNE